MLIQLLILNLKKKNSINSYNIESFILRQEKKIIEETQKEFVKLIEEDMRPKPKSNPGIAESVIDFLNPFTNSLETTRNLFVDLIIDEKARQETFTKLAMRETIKDI
jgi:hypothetical protein